MIGMEDSRTSDTLELRELGGFLFGAKSYLDHFQQEPSIYGSTNISERIRRAPLSSSVSDVLESSIPIIIHPLSGPPLHL